MGVCTYICECRQIVIHIKLNLSVCLNIASADGEVKTLSALPEDPSSGPSTSVRQLRTTCNYSARGVTSSSGLYEHSQAHAP